VKDDKHNYRSLSMGGMKGTILSLDKTP